MHRPLPLTCLLTMLVQLTAGAAVAGDWRSGWGIASSPGAAVPADEALARLRLATGPTGTRPVLDNLTAGPVQVRLQAAAAPAVQTYLLRAGQQLPVPATVSAGWRLDAVPGTPQASAADVAYQLPFATAPVRVHQGFDGHYSHSDDENRYALDFPLPEGTPVLAARAGMVMQVIDHHLGNHQDPARRGHGANLVRVLHDDGSMALYAHLRAGSAQVRPGQKVTVGQPLAASGNTGFSTAPHLHFAVQLNRGLHLESVPFRLDGPHGELRLPRATAAP